MSTPPTPSTATPIDAATLAAHPELAVLTLDLPVAITGKVSCPLTAGKGHAAKNCVI